MSTHYFAFQYCSDSQGELAVAQTLHSSTVAGPEKVICVMVDGSSICFDPIDHISDEIGNTPREKQWNLAWDISRRILLEHYEKLFMLSGKVGLGEYRRFLKYRQACVENLTFFSPLTPYYCYEGYPLFAIGDPKKANTILFLRT